MAGLSGFFIMGDSLSPLLAGIDVLEEAKVVLEDVANDVQAYAQGNAPWTDRTGDARAGLTADVFVDGDTAVLQLYHTVDYGLWLETIQGGAFAIIMPTLESFSQDILEKCSAVEVGSDLG